MRYQTHATKHSNLSKNESRHKMPRVTTTHQCKLSPFEYFRRAVAKPTLRLDDVWEQLVPRIHRQHAERQIIAMPVSKPRVNLRVPSVRPTPTWHGIQPFCRGYNWGARTKRVRVSKDEEHHVKHECCTIGVLKAGGHTCTKWASMRDCRYEGRNGILPIVEDYQRRLPRNQ